MRAWAGPGVGMHSDRTQWLCVRDECRNVTLSGSNMGPRLGRESKVLKNCRREPCEDVRE